MVLTVHFRGAGALVVLAWLYGSGAACTAGVVPGDAHEEPLLFNAALIEPLPADSNAMVSVIWTDPLQRRADLPMPPRWIGSTVAEAVPSEADGRLLFSLQLFRAPPPEMLAEIESPSGETALVALGELVIVDDADNNGTFAIDAHGTIVGPDAADGDKYLAGTSAVLFYVARPFSSPISRSPGPFDKPGYQLVQYTCVGALLVDYKLTTGALFENQVSRALIERRTCARTHSP